MALSDARTAWMTRYGEAERTWALAHDEAGVQYDVGEQMTPLESRVASLASAEEAWMLRSGSALTLAEERARLEVNDLTQRLESLQYTVLNTERRWRSAGHGFAASNQGPNGGDQDGGRINTCALMEEGPASARGQAARRGAASGATSGAASGGRASVAVELSLIHI